MFATSAVVDLVGRSHAEEAWERRAWLERELADLDADAVEVVAAAAAGLDSDDRNVRVRVLRVLALFPDERATAAVLRGLRDPVRRVREVAIDASRPHHIASPAVVDALHSIMDDQGERERVQRAAFSALSNSVFRDELSQESLVGLTGSQRFRLPVLVRLCKMTDHTPDSRAILHEFVRTGTKEEAILATRALSGYLPVGIGSWLPPAEQQRVRDAYDSAPEFRAAATGGLMVAAVDACWLPRDDAVALARAAGYTNIIP